MSLDSEFFDAVDDVGDFIVDEDAVMEGIKDLFDEKIFQDKLTQETLDYRIEGNSFSIPLLNSRKFKYVVKQDYENKAERLGLLRQTFYNIGVQRGNAACSHEGFLFKGYQLNENEFKALRISCKKKWGFFLCKFFLLENLIKSQQITLKEWKTHGQNIRHPLCKDEPNLITTRVYFTLFTESFSIETSPDVALATFGSVHRLQGIDANDSKFLSRCSFSERFNIARCSIAEKLNSQGRTEEMKSFLILQLDQLHTDTSKKRPRAEGQEEKLAGPGKELAEGPPEKKKIKAVVLKAAPEKKKIKAVVLKAAPDMVDSDDSKTSRENSPATSPENSPREKDAKVQGVKEENVGEPKPVDRFNGYEAEIKTIRNVAPELSIEAATTLLNDAGGDVGTTLNAHFATDNAPSWSRLYLNTNDNGDRDNGDRDNGDRDNGDRDKKDSKYLVQSEDEEEITIDIPELNFDGTVRRRNAQTPDDLRLRRCNYHRGGNRLSFCKRAWRERQEPRHLSLITWTIVFVGSLIGIAGLVALRYIFASEDFRFRPLYFNHTGVNIMFLCVVSLPVLYPATFWKPTLPLNLFLLVYCCAFSTWLGQGLADPPFVACATCALWTLCYRVNRWFCVIPVVLLSGVIYFLLEWDWYLIIRGVKVLWTIGSLYLEQRNQTTSAVQIIFSPVRDFLFILAIPLAIAFHCN